MLITPNNNKRYNKNIRKKQVRFFNIKASVASQYELETHTNYFIHYSILCFL